MTLVDIYGDIVDPEWVERQVETTLRAWLPAHLALQAERSGLTLLAPRSWTTLSEFDIEAHDQLPAVLILSPGTAGEPQRNQKGGHTVTWRVEVVFVVGDATERQARRLGGLYLAAGKGALVQNRTLGGTVEKCIWRGPDDHAWATTRQGQEQRAIYGTAFEVTVKDAINDRLGPDTPPQDPLNPPAPPERPNEALITVTSIGPQETP